MVLKKAESSISNMLSDTIVAMCKNSLSYEGQVSVEGLLGITLDNNQIFLVNIQETISKENIAAKVTPPLTPKKRTRQTSKVVSMRDSPSTRSAKRTRQAASEETHHSDSPSEAESKSSECIKRSKRRKRSNPTKFVKRKSADLNNGGALDESSDSDDKSEYEDKENHVETVTKLEEELDSAEPAVCVKEEPQDFEDEYLNNVVENTTDSNMGHFMPMIDKASLHIPLNPQLQDLAMHMARSTTQATSMPTLEPAVAIPSTSQGTSVSPSAITTTGVRKQPIQARKQNVATDITTVLTSNKVTSYTASLHFSDLCDMDMVRHEVESRPHICDICNRTFANPANLRSHRVVHLTERPYKCAVCDRGFSRSGHLQVHMRMHTGEKPFKCDKCEKDFRDSGHLRRHQHSVH